jgi:hypothetical protein
MRHGNKDQAYVMPLRQAPGASLASASGPWSKASTSLRMHIDTGSVGSATRPASATNPRSDCGDCATGFLQKSNTAVATAAVACCGAFRFSLSAGGGMAAASESARCISASARNEASVDMACAAPRAASSSAVNSASS